MACTHNKSTIRLLKFKKMSKKNKFAENVMLRKKKEYVLLACLFLITAETAGVDNIPSLY